MGELKTEKQAIKYVQTYARHYAHGFMNTGSEYAVGYKNKFYHSNEIRDIVEAICRDYNIPLEG